METTDRLGLSYVMAAQAQKHITVNETFRQLDALAQMRAASRTGEVQPASPGPGDAYILPIGKTGTDWSAMASGSVASFQDGMWQEIAVVPGLRVFVEDEEATYLYNGSDWVPLTAFRFTTGGDGVISIYRNDLVRAQNPRTDVISNVAADIITLPVANAAQYFFDEDRMAGVSWLRVWNMSKSPAESAWVRAVPDWAGARQQLQVTDADDIIGWISGETLQLGDPEEITPGRVIALDISPMLQNVFGKVFPQKGIYCKGGLGAALAGDSLSLSPDGSAGSFSGLTRVHVDNLFADGSLIVSSGVSSPVSASNLVFIREKFAITGGVSIASIVAVLT